MGRTQRSGEEGAYAVLIMAVVYAVAVILAHVAMIGAVRIELTRVGPFARVVITAASIWGGVAAVVVS